MDSLRKYLKTSSHCPLRKLDIWLSENQNKIRNKRSILEIIESFKDGSDGDRQLEFLQNMICEGNSVEINDMKKRLENVVKGGRDGR